MEAYTPWTATYSMYSAEKKTTINPYNLYAVAVIEGDALLDTFTWRQFSNTHISLKAFEKSRPSLRFASVHTSTSGSCFLFLIHLCRSHEHNIVFLVSTTKLNSRKHYRQYGSL